MSRDGDWFLCLQLTLGFQIQHTHCCECQGSLLPTNENQPQPGPAPPGCQGAPRSQARRCGKTRLRNCSFPRTETCCFEKVVARFSVYNSFKPRERQRGVNHLWCKATNTNKAVPAPAKAKFGALCGVAVDADGSAMGMEVESHHCRLSGCLGGLACQRNHCSLLTAASVALFREFQTCCKSWHKQEFPDFKELQYGAKKRWVLITT